MMKVKAYNTGKYQNTTTYEVRKIDAMPEPDEITDDEKALADGIMLHLTTTDGRDIFLPHSFLISIE